MASGPLVYSRKSHNKSSKFSVTPTLPSLPPSDDSRSSTLDRPQNSGFLHARRKITLSSRSKHEIRDIRRKLTNELNQVRILVKRLESHESDPNGGYSHSRAGSEVASAGPRNHRVRQLSISTAENSTSEKEKRTPKANQYYRNSEFVVGKEKFMRLPPPETAKKQVDEGLKECLNILTKLIKHKYGWVFAKPVDVKDLGLHDYYTIVKHPMDLGTVRSRLENNYYKSPVEFAEDVRLTFHNAMTYNPKGHDVHIMAEQLARLFEDRWADPADQGVGPPAHPLKKALPPELKRTLDRSESTNVRPDMKVVNVTPTGRVAAPKKPKAKDPHKRDMTFDEKQKLSSNLMNLPSEKLDNIVQIIKKRNTSLSHHDDEIEVDIDSFDAETLWELDRFVTNYKKSLSKYKRKAELAGQAGQVVQHDNAQDMFDLQNPVTSRTEEPKESKAVETNISYTSPVQGEKHGVKASRSSSSSSSSSDSGSSSSGSESGSSSGRSGEGRSPRN